MADSDIAVEAIFEGGTSVEPRLTALESRVDKLESK
jgi:hypothetical protein